MHILDKFPRHWTKRAQFTLVGLLPRSGITAIITEVITYVILETREERNTFYKSNPDLIFLFLFHVLSFSFSFAFSFSFHFSLSLSPFRRPLMTKMTSEANRNTINMLNPTSTTRTTTSSTSTTSTTSSPVQAQNTSSN